MRTLGRCRAGQDDRDRGTVDAFEPPDVEQRRGQHGARRAGRDDRVRLAVRNGLRGAHEGRVGLRAHGLDRVVVHLDDLGGLDERQPERVEPARARTGSAGSSEDAPRARPRRSPRGRGRPPAHRPRRGRSSSESLGGLDADRLDVPALVRLAVRAHAMRALRLPAGRAELDARDGDPMLRAALVAPRLRRLSLRDGHKRLRSIARSGFSLIAVLRCDRPARARASPGSGGRGRRRPSCPRTRERGLELLDGLEVEVVRRLVEDEEVHRPRLELREMGARPLAGREARAGTADVIGAEPELREQRPRLLGRRGPCARGTRRAAARPSRTPRGPARARRPRFSRRRCGSRRRAGPRRGASRAASTSRSRSAR